ncbi:MAG: hypothetical protein ACNFW9_03955 [Candidatus Kerfeldbacteria bacterium]|jgi:hypothetical protein
MKEDKKEILQENSDSSKVKKTKIYTMPSKFYVEDNSSGGGKNYFLIIAIIVLVLAIAGGGVYMLLQKDSEPEPIVPIENVNSTVNSNSNENINVNVNSNTNLDTNINSNSNLNVKNVNLNLFNDNVNTNIPVNLNINSNVGSSLDTDKDGLTDIEEALFGTSISLADTDTDGYTDGQEVVGGYDPKGEGKLENSQKVRFYNDVVSGFSLLYPSAWVVDNDPINPGGKIFTSGEEFVVVSIQDNPANLSARDWYLTKSPGINSSLIKTVSNWENDLNGVISLDGLNVYYSKSSKIYVLSYNINILSEASFSTVFEMMSNSFNASTPSRTNTNTNSNTNLNTNTAVNSNSNTNTTTNSNTNSEIRL